MGSVLRSTLPASPGSYLLVLRLGEATKLGVGRLGAADLAPGLYVYAGSARGPGGLAARLGRHLDGQGKPRWHVDYLRAATRPVGAAVQVETRRLECRWARHLFELGGGLVVRGFGATDCRCQAHLARFPEDFTALRRVLDEGLSGTLVWFDGTGSALLD